MPSCCHLKVVLFCSGNGADVNSYRPRRDESQWWNRRDALVRCVASFLFGPTSENSRELVLFYDGDYCRVHMKLEHDNGSNGNKHDVIPSEYTIISLWKEAIAKAIQTAREQPTNNSTVMAPLRKGSLCCWAVLSTVHGLPQIIIGKTKNAGGKNMNNNNNNNAAVARMIQDWSKRQLLEYLQKECSMEFLREHKLNSAPNVILRKANRSALAKVYHAWHKSNSKSSTNNTNNSTNNNNGPAKSNHTGKQVQLSALETIFRELLLDEKLSSGGKDHQLIAGTLHESSDCELPCFGDDNHLDKPLHLCLFLGAVRDMIPVEYQALENACHTRTSSKEQKEIPLVKVRLGSVPEFTSKILSVVAFHHAQEKLGPAILQLVQRSSSLSISAEKLNEKNTAGSKRQHPGATVTSDDEDDPQQQQTTAAVTSRLGRRPPILHIVCFVPLHSNQIVTDLDQRNRILWCVVRVLVCSLWRSRLAGTTSNRSSPLQNSVTLILLDGQAVTLHQKEWVASMAEQHQAAPSEYQVLKGLGERLKQEQPKQKSAAWNEERTLQVLKELLVPFSQQSSRPTVISLEKNGSTDLTQRFYRKADSSKDVDEKHCRDLLVLLPIAPISDPTEDQALFKDVPPTFLRALSTHLSLPVLRQSIIAPIATLALNEKTNQEKICGDWEASSITVLQHFMYQERLFCFEADSINRDGRVEDDACEEKERKKMKKSRKQKMKRKKRSGYFK